MADSFAIDIIPRTPRTFDSHNSSSDVYFDYVPSPISFTNVLRDHSEGEVSKYLLLEHPGSLLNVCTSYWRDGRYCFRRNLG